MPWCPSLDDRPMTGWHTPPPSNAPPAPQTCLKTSPLVLIPHLPKGAAFCHRPRIRPRQCRKPPTQQQVARKHLLCDRETCHHKPSYWRTGSSPGRISGRTNMQAHRVRVTIPEDHKVTIDVPRSAHWRRRGDRAVQRIRGPAPACRHNLRPRVFVRTRRWGRSYSHEDPTLPVSEEDWPSDLRPLLFLLGPAKPGDAKVSQARATESGARERFVSAYDSNIGRDQAAVPARPNTNPKYSARRSWPCRGRGRGRSDSCSARATAT